MIYDIHTHIFPEKIAARGVANIGNYYSLPMECNGTANGLTENMLPDMKCVISSASLKEETMVLGNDFLLDCAKENKSFIPFSSFYPHSELKTVADELERVKKSGTYGIKLHPDFQKFNIDDDNVIPMYRVCAELDLPVLFHIGDKNTDYSTPLRMRRVAEKIPSLKIIAAHMCGYSVWDDAEKYLIGTDVYTEVSDAIFCLSEERILDMIRRHGVEKVMFGSDYPLTSPKTAFKAFDAFDLTNYEKQRIYTENFEKLFGITV